MWGLLLRAPPPIDGGTDKVRDCAAAQGVSKYANEQLGAFEACSADQEPTEWACSTRRWAWRRTPSSTASTRVRRLPGPVPSPYLPVNARISLQTASQYGMAGGTSCQQVLCRRRGRCLGGGGGGRPRGAVASSGLPCDRGAAPDGTVVRPAAQLIRGMYSIFLERWMQVLPRHNLLAVHSNDFLHVERIVMRKARVAPFQPLGTSRGAGGASFAARCNRGAAARMITCRPVPRRLRRRKE